MKNFIQIENEYIVKFCLENIHYSDIGKLLKELLDDVSWHWNCFYANDKLWYCDGSKFLKCQAVNHDEKVIIFG